MPDGVRVRRIKAELPALRIPHTVMREVGKVVEGNILENIQTQRQADGAGLKQNAPSTMARKQRLGRPLLSLVDRLHRFVRGNRASWRWTVSKKKATRRLVVTEPATADLKNLVRWVQEKGYTGWFGLSDKGREAIRHLFRTWIKSEFRKAAAKSRTNRGRR